MSNAKTNKKKKNTEKKDTAINQNTSLIREAVGFALFALGLFFFFALIFQTAGKFGEIINAALKGTFGLPVLILPFFLIGEGIYIIIKNKNQIKAGRFVYYSLIFIGICFINAKRFISPDVYIDKAYLVECYNQGGLLLSGGVFPSCSDIVLIKLIGVSGLFILSFFLILIPLNIITGNPVAKISSGTNKEKNKKENIKEERPKKNIINEKMPDNKKAGVFIKYMKEFSGNKSGKTTGIEPKIEPLEGYGLNESEGNDNRKIKENKKKKKKNKKGIVIEPFKEENITEEKRKISEKEPAENSDIKNASIALIKEGITENKNIKKYIYPDINLLEKTKETRGFASAEELQSKAQKLEETLQNFNVDARVTKVTQGPTVTRYEIQPDTGVKVSSITKLTDDIALNLKAKSLRMEAPIPGKAAIGIEIENDTINTVTAREIINSKEFKEEKSKIAFAVGKDISGKPIIADLKDMPHLLIAGSTGSGKSVCINMIINSILYKSSPEEVKLILIDPKVVELGNYNGIPHLLVPVVTDPSKAAGALKWAVDEMNNRYKKFAQAGVRNLSGFNKLVRKMKETPVMKKNEEDDTSLLEQDIFNEEMPQIVIIIDELADLMMVASKQIEESICRLAQLARAAGIHMIVATQRPSTDVITGLIKSNIPARIAFAVSSSTDSRIILDMSGAEKLVGKGDMLFYPSGANKPTRVQGAFLSDTEINNVTDFIKKENGEGCYQETVINAIDNCKISSDSNNPQDDEDELINDAIECVALAQKASTSMLQRRFRIGYNRAARIIEDLENRGIIGPQNDGKSRQVLMTKEDFYEYKKRLVLK